MYATGPDGITWTSQTPATNRLWNIIWVDGLFVAVGDGGTILTSLDGIGWTTQASGTLNDFHNVIWSGSRFVIVGANGTILISEPASEMKMNAGLNDVLYYSVTDGQGFFINVFSDIGYVSLSWFTYDTERPPEDITANLGEPGHRWLNAIGPYTGNQAVMDVSYATGGIFDSPTAVIEVSDGTIILTFTDCKNGTVEYDIPSINQQGTVPIQRIVFDNVPLCETLSSQ